MSDQGSVAAGAGIASALAVDARKFAVSLLHCDAGYMDFHAVQIHARLGDGGKEIADRVAVMYREVAGKLRAAADAIEALPLGPVQP
jgi:hypothetical protein